ncbi:5'-nucleotidase [Colwellia piezophila]|uniref:5'-nucleotidase n=1 Tax=Colwellia piezophila TaxID=211668 RepID=UPI00037A7C82|nr:5'-nucleotidase [Colwellia piezophila]
MIEINTKTDIDLNINKNDETHQSHKGKGVDGNSHGVSSNTLTIGITGELANQHHQICEFLSKLHEHHCQEMNIKILLLASCEHGRLIPLLSQFTQQGLTFNKVVMTQYQQLVDVTKVMQPDIVMTTDTVFAEQLEGNSLPVIVVDQNENNRVLGKQLHFSFDGDAVLFCHNAQTIADQQGIAAFEEHEQKYAGIEMGKGVLYNFIKKIDVLQNVNKGIKWSLVTARGGKALKRAMHTIEQWQLSPSQCFFMEGSDKTPILKIIDSDIFFDDHPKHCQRASGHMLVGHVQVGSQTN